MEFTLITAVHLMDNRIKSLQRRVLLSQLNLDWKIDRARKEIKAPNFKIARCTRSDD